MVTTQNKLIILLCTLFITNMAYSKKYSNQRPYLQNIYEVFDYVHRTMYSDEYKTTEEKILKVYSNDLFKDNLRTTLNEKGIKIHTELMKIKSANEGYDIQYCWVPIEKYQLQNYYEWYNKDQFKFSSMHIKIEEGTNRITDLYIDIDNDLIKKNKFYTMSCTQTSHGAIVKGKRTGLDDIKPNTQILAFDKTTNFWHEATFINQVNDTYIVSFPNISNTVVTQIVPIEIDKNDLVYFYKDSFFIRGIITEINGIHFTVNLSDGTSINTERKDLFFRINTFQEKDINSQLFEIKR